MVELSEHALQSARDEFLPVCKAYCKNEGQVRAVWSLLERLLNNETTHISEYESINGQNAAFQKALERVRNVLTLYGTRNRNRLLVEVRDAKGKALSRDDAFVALVVNAKK